MYQIIFSEQKIFEPRKNIWKTPFVVYVGFVNNICGRMFYGLMKPNVNFNNTIVKVFRAQKQHRASLEKKKYFLHHDKTTCFKQRNLQFMKLPPSCFTVVSQLDVSLLGWH